MRLAFRLAGLGLLAVLVLVGGFFLTRGHGGTGTPAGIQAPSFPVPDGNRACAECHGEIYEQWAASMHAMAWDDPQLQVPGMGFKEKPDCWPCHVPGPIFLSGLGMLPQARSHRRSEGVGCIDCHYTIEGMAGKVTNPAPPCRPVARTEMAEMKVCSGCHNQHKTHDEWAASAFYPETDCNDCHMPEVEGEPTRGEGKKRYRAHTWPGCHDLEMLRKAFTLTARVEEGPTAVVEITNDKAGHNFPTDARFHRADLVVDVLLPTGGTVDQFEFKFKNPFRGVVGVENTQLKSGETKRFDRALRLPDGVEHGTLRVRVLYCLQPYPGKEGDRLEGDTHALLQELLVRF